MKVQNWVILNFSILNMTLKKDIGQEIIEKLQELNSNLDDLFVKKMNAILSGEVAAAKKKLKSKIDKEVNKYKSQLNSTIADKEKMIKTGKFDPGGLGKAGYVPEGGINITRSGNP